MQVRLNVQNIDLRDTQEKMDNNIRQVRDASRRVVLAYAGLWGMAYDEAATLIDKGKSILEKAEHRGETLEHNATEQVKKVGKQARSRLQKVEARVESLQGKVKSRTERAENKVEYDLETQVERVLDRLGIPSRDRIMKLSEEIEALSLKIDAQMAADKGIVVKIEAEPMAMPLVNYTELTAKEIVNLFDKLSIAELVEIKRFEEAHENRVTVLREANRRIESMPIAGYDEMTVEEIESRLVSLSVEQLDYLVAYEKTHQNRVTLLSKIESAQESRRVAIA
ncbi:MAG: phasin family protein [Caldilineaceae bacterium]|nr:phasin family protein [Caldilineaceae bacterium]